MPMPGRNGSYVNYRMGYNGYEKDDEIYGNGNSIDFTARFYDSNFHPRVTLFMVIIIQYYL